ncbi:protein spire 1-like protein, partial [Dinothrombium tinctorium]
ETSRTKLDENDKTPQPQRRLIKADLTLRLSNNYEDEDDLHLDLPAGEKHEDVFENDGEESVDARANETLASKATTAAATSDSHETRSQTPKSGNLKKRFSFKNFARALSFERHERRHSISVCESPSGKSSSVEKADFQESNNNQTSDELVIDPNEDTRERVASIWAATAWGKTYDCLSLTLDEVQHIRSVLTKAELESLGVTKSIRDDLEKGKICFTCLKTRFSFFGPWPIRCKLCERLICEKCCTQMHVPTEHYAEIPIYMLSPTPTPSPPGDEDPNFFPSFPQNILSSDEELKQQPSKSRKSKLLRALTLSRTESKQNKTEVKESKSNESSFKPLSNLERRRNGPLMKLCRDCKLLVRHIIDVGHANYDSSFGKTWPRKNKRIPSRGSSQSSRTDAEYNTTNEEIAQKAIT